jgi:hypothetical protein
MDEDIKVGRTEGSALTPIEIGVLCGLVEGLGDHGIAARLGQPVAAVKRHVREIHRKLFLRPEALVAASGPAERELFDAPELRELVAVEIERRFVDAIAASLGEASGWSASRAAMLAEYRQRLVDLDAAVEQLRLRTDSARRRFAAHVAEPRPAEPAAPGREAARPVEPTTLRELVRGLADFVMARAAGREAAVLGYVRDAVGLEIAHRRHTLELDRRCAELMGRQHCIANVRQGWKGPSGPGRTSWLTP